jgi:hypothetical protein
MKFACPNCGQRLEAETAWAGRQINCPTCSGSIVIPGQQGVPASAGPGVAASANVLPAEAGTPNAARKRRVPIYAAAVGVLLLGIALAGRWFFTPRAGASSNSPAASLFSFFDRADLSEVKVFPTEVHLGTKQDRQSIVVQATYADGATRDVTKDASFSLGNKALARLEKDTLYPATDGKTELQVKFSGKSLVVPVTVESAKVERPISFRLDVIPALTKSGCNSGACHGSSRGKDGFRMSLFGYDPDGDYQRITREQIGRRVNLAIPEESLLIEKGLGAVPHTGGERFKKGDEIYNTLMRWLQAGAPKDETNVAKVTGIDIMPKAAVLEGQGASQKFMVRAKYSDGTDRDVTSLAVFISNNEPAAKVLDGGLVTAGQRGESFVMARFDTFSVGSQVIVVPKNAPYKFPDDVAEYNYVDTLVHAKLKKLRITPSGLCDDATFIRRLYLDITGTLPTAQEVTAFVEEPSAGKRDQLIDELLDRKEFAELWVMKWAELLQIRSRQDQFSYKAALSYYNWLQDKMLNNVPIDKIVQDLITASGSTFKNPAANYYQVQTDTLKTAENTAQVFMGMRVQCAQCHNHPFDRWTMNDYYSFAAFFPQVGRKQGEDPRETIIFDKGDGDVKHPVGNKTMKPKFLGGDVPEINGHSRREVLAKWIASPDNPYFAKNLANIVWAHFMGKGIIDPVDDVRISNPPSNPELLDALAGKFTEYGYNFKRFVKDICSSRTYQLSTRANESNALDDRNFAKASIRRMRAEVLFDCISQVTDTKNKFQGLPRGARAVQIADGNVTSYFLTTFGRATRESVCSCEVKTEPNLSQALHLLNGSTTNEKIKEGGVIKALLKDKAPPQIVDDLYLRCLGRKPGPQELEKVNGFMKDGKPEDVLNDLFWSLLNSKEFIFNH